MFAQSWRQTRSGSAHKKQYSGKGREENESQTTWKSDGPAPGKHTQTLRCYSKKAGVAECDPIHPAFEKGLLKDDINPVALPLPPDFVLYHTKSGKFQPAFVDDVATSSQGNISSHFLPQ